MNKTVPLKLWHPDGTETVTRVMIGDTTEPTTPCFIEYQHPQRGSKRFSGQDFFSCLRDLRLLLEQEGIKVLCNGARVNAWVSGLASQMSRGGAVYLVKIGEPVGHNGVVPLFGPAEAESVGTVSEQLAFQEAWWASLP